MAHFRIGVKPVALKFDLAYVEIVGIGTCPWILNTKVNIFLLGNNSYEGTNGIDERLKSNA